MLDHVGFSVADYEKSKAFYEKALKPLGIGVVMEVTPEQTGSVAAAGVGHEEKPYFWIGTGDKPKGGQHVAFATATRKAVDAFYAAAIAAGPRQWRARPQAALS
jgi:catechol 2,3-dioxygenase-like lactoylglutathione lyase family enzyme